MPPLLPPTLRPALVLALALSAPAGALGAETLRVATFNAALNRAEPGALAAEITAGDSAQLAKVAAIIAEVAPDILLLNEVDYAPGLAESLAAQTLDGAFDHVFSAPSNTGLSSGRDLDGDGTATTAPGSVEYGNDSYGFGFFEGQYGMAVLSKYDILDDQVRTFQRFKWADMPGARRPVNADGTPFHPDEVWADLRLSSKSHWDVPVQIGDQIVHFLVSHPTPPVFDGPEDRNGTRNADEIRFWADYVSGASYMTDDQGQTGGLAAGALFVIAGDLNADPADGDSTDLAATQLLSQPGLITDPAPRSEGAAEAAAVQGGSNGAHRGDAAMDTADWNDAGPGNLRVDYVLPSATLTVNDAGVFWPKTGQPGAAWIDASDHRLVWADITLP